MPFTIDPTLAGRIAGLGADSESALPDGATSMPRQLTEDELDNLESLVSGGNDESGLIDPSIVERMGSLDLSAFFSSGVTLNPEMVLAMTRARLRDLDNQLHMNMTKLNEATELSQDLAARQEALQEVRARLAEETEKASNKKPLSELTMPDGRNAEEYLAAHGITDITGQQSTNSMDSHIDVVKSQSRQINSGNEMLMLTIQTLTQQRSQVLQLGTSLVKKIHEGEQTIAGNIGR
jgi:DNA polymerase III psi subunit